MGRTKKILLIALSSLMAAQAPAMAGELVVEDEALLIEEAVHEETGVMPEFIQENAAGSDTPGEAIITEDAVEEDIEEVPVTEESSDAFLFEEPEEESIIPEDSFDVDLEEEPVEEIIEDIAAEPPNDVVSDAEGLIVEDEPESVGASSGKCGDNVSWTLNDDNVLVISGTGNMWDWEDFTGANNSPWYEVREKVKNVIINPGVTNIGENAFCNCYSLTSITIPDTVTSIEWYAFSDCSSLTSITIPGSVTNIGGQAFLNCSSLESVTIPNSVTCIKQGTFSYCTSLKNVTIPDSVTSIEMSAFHCCRSLTGITIPDKVLYIEGGVFFGCSALATVTIPDSVVSIWESAFEKCSSLESITIPDSVKKIEMDAFSECASLSSITIPGGVTEIGDNAFGGCSSLKTIKFEGDAPKFGSNAWDSNNTFKNVTATACFPYDNRTWAPGVRKNYGGKITWVPVRENGKVGFRDVTDPLKFFYEAVYWAVDTGITTGFNDYTFRLYTNCNRAAVVTFLWRLAGKPDRGITNVFSDMTGNSDFDHAITWASEIGITTGYDDGTFRPWVTCNRSAIVTFLWRYAGEPAPAEPAGFSDMTDNDDFNNAISWAAEKGITTGYDDGTFRPWNECQRQAVVTFLWRFAGLEE